MVVTSNEQKYSKYSYVYGQACHNCIRTSINKVPVVFSSLHILSQNIRLLYIEFNDLNWYVFISTTIVGTQPHLKIILSGGGKFFHEPRRIVKGTARVQSTTTLTIPEGIIGIEYDLPVIFTASITEVVTPHIGWDGDVH